MELQEFISQSLIQICEGIASARASKGDYAIAPKISDHAGSKATLRVNDGYATAFMVDFDVAVTATDTRDTGGKGSLKVMGVGIGGHKSVTTENESVSRIKFSIPICYEKPHN